MYDTINPYFHSARSMAALGLQLTTHWANLLAETAVEDAYDHYRARLQGDDDTLTVVKTRHLRDVRLGLVGMYEFFGLQFMRRMLEQFPDTLIEVAAVFTNRLISWEVMGASPHRFPITTPVDQIKLLGIIGQFLIAARVIELRDPNNEEDPITGDQGEDRCLQVSHALIQTLDLDAVAEDSLCAFLGVGYLHATQTLAEPTTDSSDEHAVDLL